MRKVLRHELRQLLTAYTAAQGEQTLCQLKLGVFTKWISEITSSLKKLVRWDVTQVHTSVKADKRILFRQCGVCSSAATPCLVSCL